MSANVSRDTLGNTATKVSQPAIIISNNLMKMYFTVKGRFSYKSYMTLTNLTVYLREFNGISSTFWFYLWCILLFQM